MNADNSYQHELENATPATDIKLKSLFIKFGFTYHNAIGEIIYAITHVVLIYPLPPLN